MDFIKTSQKHFRDIKDDGLGELLRKFRNLLKLLKRSILSVIIGVPLVLMSRLLRPFILVRFGQLTTSRIGHLAGNTEVYVTESRQQRESGCKPFVDFFYLQPGREISNHQLFKMIKQNLNILKMAEFANYANKWFPFSDWHEINILDNNSRDMKDLFLKYPPSIKFSDKEELFGIHELNIMGVSESQPFVCFHSRDQAYLEFVDRKSPDLKKKVVKNYDHRDSDFNDYIPAIEYLDQHGAKSLRMGAVVGEDLDVCPGGLVDYAKNYRSDFMDVYLAQKCDFFVATACGANAAPMIFRKPLVLVNWVPLGGIFHWCNDSLFIPKKIFSEKLGRILMFREIINSEINRAELGEVYKELGCKVLENTPGEILEVVKEMSKRRSGEWVEKPDENQLQGELQEILLKSDFIENPVRIRMGYDFLKKNIDLLS